MHCSPRPARWRGRGAYRQGHARPHRLLALLPIEGGGRASEFGQVGFEKTGAVWPSGLMLSKLSVGGMCCSVRAVAVNVTSLGLIAHCRHPARRVIYQTSGCDDVPLLMNRLLLQYRSVSCAAVLGVGRDPWAPGGRRLREGRGAAGTSLIRPRGRGTLKL